MRAIVWNCRGLRSTSAKQRVRHMLKEKNPDIVYLCETFCTVEQAKYAFCFSAFMHFAGSDVVGRKGGTLLMWKDSVTINILDITPHWIHCVLINSVGVCAVITFVYGHPKLHYRSTMWQFLMQVSAGIDAPWMVTGDFNQVMEAKDKLSINQSLDGAKDFQDAVNQCGLVDLVPSGNWFTWSNNREGINVVWERLDRVFVNVCWLEAFPTTSVFCFPVVKSDHSPLIISTCNELPRRFRPSKFEAMWLVNNACNDVVQSAWNESFQGSAVYFLMSEIHHTMFCLRKWNKNEFCHVPTKIKNLTQQLQDTQIELSKNSILTEVGCNLSMKEKALRLELNEWLDREEVMWAQRAKQLWMINGDRNTKYFHSLVKKRKASSIISRIKDQYGNWIEAYEDLEKEADSFFSGIYKHSNITVMKVGDFVPQQLHIPYITEEDSRSLLNPIHKSEIKNAFFSNGPL